MKRTTQEFPWVQFNIHIISSWNITRFLERTQGKITYSGQNVLMTLWGIRTSQRFSGDFNDKHKESGPPASWRTPPILHKHLLLPFPQGGGCGALKVEPPDWKTSFFSKSCETVEHCWCSLCCTASVEPFTLKPPAHHYSAQNFAWQWYLRLCLMLHISFHRLSFFFLVVFYPSTVFSAAFIGNYWDPRSKFPSVQNWKPVKLPLNPWTTQ